MNRVIISKLPKTEYATQESLNTICSNILFSGVDVKRILVTSSSAGNGKSYASILMARSFAARGMRVLLIDADLRRSQLNKKYGIKYEVKSVGLANYLAGYSTEGEVIYATDIDNMYLIPIGRTVSNPIPFLSGERMERLMRDVKENFDIVIVDAPPIGQVVDAAQLALYCDGAILVVSYNSTTRRELLEVKQQMNKTGISILGCIINQVDYESLSAKKYYYKYKSYYYHK